MEPYYFSPMVPLAVKSFSGNVIPAIKTAVLPDQDLSES